MSEHTSMPWRTTGCTVWAKMTHVDGRGVAHHIDTQIAYLPANAYRVANARLIAAAPELLEAANNTVAYYAKTMPGRTCLNDELNPCGGLRHWGGGESCPLCSARAATAKAKGEKQ